MNVYGKKLLLTFCAVSLLSVAMVPLSLAETTTELTPKAEITQKAKAAVPHITAENLQEKIDKKENFYLIDVRTMPEYQTGHIEGALWIPRGWLEFKTAKIIKDPNADIVVYCTAGSRGSLSAKALLDMGYKNVKDLNGGLSAWLGEDYPLFNLLGKIQVVDFKAKETSPHGTGVVRQVYH